LLKAGDFGKRQISPAKSLIERCIDRLEPFDGRDLTDLVADMNRQTVGQPEDDVLEEIGRIQVGKIPARAPAGMLGSRGGRLCGRDARGPADTIRHLAG
jgi:hypothetical protein